MFGGFQGVRQQLEINALFYKIKAEWYIKLKGQETGKEMKRLHSIIELDRLLSLKKITEWSNKKNQGYEKVNLVEVVRQHLDVTTKINE